MTPSSERWKNIMNTKDEASQARKICIYVHELEDEVRKQELEIKALIEMNEMLRIAVDRYAV